MTQQIATAQGNGSSTGITIPRNVHISSQRSHLRTLFVWGTFGGATVSYQISHNSTNGTDGNWFDVANADAITAASAINVEHRAPWHRITVAGGTGESINAAVL